MPLVVEQTQLRTRLIAVEALIEENQVAKEKLRSLVAHCQEIKQLPPGSKATVSIRRNLEKRLKEVREEIQLADQFLNRMIPWSVVRPQQVFITSFFQFFLLELYNNFAGRHQ